jgi:hypothetical protein
MFQVAMIPYTIIVNLDKHARTQKCLSVVIQQARLYKLINEGLLAIPESYEKLIISLRTAQAKEYSLDKEQTSYDDLLDALRLSLKGHKIE